MNGSALSITQNIYPRTRAVVGVFSYFARRMLRQSQAALAEVANRSVTICEAGELPAITPFHWEAHLPRVRSSSTYGADRVIRDDLNRKVFQFRPVIAHWLKDATLLDGSVYAGGYRHELRNVYKRSRIGVDVSGIAAEIERAALVSTCAGSTWWGHWVEDEVPMQMLAEGFAKPVAFNRESYRDEGAYRKVFGIAEPERFDVAHFHELLVIDEFAQNPNKTKRYRNLRNKLLSSPPGYDKVYLRRGVTGVRRVLANEAEVIERVESLGFKIVDISNLTADEIIAACRGASVVVSVEGSHLAPLLYLMKDFGVMVILNPPYRIETTVADIGVFCGLSSGMFICEPVGNSQTDFRADPDELARFIDDALAFGKQNQSRLESFLETVTSMDRTDAVLGTGSKAGSLGI